LHAEDVVVGREHVHGSLRRVLEGDGDLRVVNAREVARASRLVLFRAEGERVAVHTRVRGTGVVHVRHDLVVELAVLSLGAVLTVEDELEFRKRTVGTGRAFFNPALTGATGTHGVERGTNLFDRDERVGVSERSRIGFEDNGIVVRVGSEVPRGGVTDGTVVEAPDEFLHRVVVGQTNLLGTVLRDGVRASVLRLFNEVFVRLLRESAAFFGVKVDVVTPDLESGTIRVTGEFTGEVEVEADFVVLQSNKRESETRGYLQR